MAELSLMALASLLRTEFPNDVLMPCQKGTKRPLHSYTKAGTVGAAAAATTTPLGGAWSWRHFDDAVRLRPVQARTARSAWLPLRSGTAGVAAAGATAALYRRFLDEYDVGILLHDLCVVDVDSDHLASTLEERFPVLKAAPMERTRKGRHYFFRRSALADEAGYYDGAGQVVPGVDLKTRCFTGSAGFLVVSPSTDKAWVRGPPASAAELTPIPDDLLAAVARARHDAVATAVAPVTFEFEYQSEGDNTIRWGSVVLSDPAVIAQLAYLDMFRDSSNSGAGDDAADMRVPLPPSICRKYNVDAGLLADTFFVCSHGHTREFPVPERVARMLGLLDFLGASRRLLLPFAVPLGHVFRDLEMEQVDADYARAVYAERVCLRQSTAAVDDDTDQQLLLVPVATDALPRLRSHDCRRGAVDSRWLFPHQNAYWERGPARLRSSGGHVAVHPFVEALLRAHPGRLVLAGGAALSAVIADTEHSDYDLFLVDATAAAAPEQAARQATELAMHIAGLQGVSVVAHTPNAVTYIVDGHRGLDGYTTPITVQLVLSINASIQDVLLGFDVTPCKVAVVAPAQQAEGCPLAAWALPTWYHCMATRTFPLDVGAWSVAAVVRVFKYVARGFDCFVPCAHRSCMVPELAALFERSELQHQHNQNPRQHQNPFYVVPATRAAGDGTSSSLHGLHGLYSFEFTLGGPRNQRPSPADVRRLTYAYGMPASGYSWLAKARGGLAGLLRMAMTAGRAWLQRAGLLSVGLTLDPAALAWTLPDAPGSKHRRNCSAVFARAAPGVADAFDEGQLAARVASMTLGHGHEDLLHLITRPRGAV